MRRSTSSTVRIGSQDVRGGMLEAPGSTRDTGGVRKDPTNAQAILRASKPIQRKYGNQPTVVDGKRFASKREASRYVTLRIKERRGEIMNLQTHKRWPLEVNGVKVADYEDDFNYSPILDGSLPGPVTIGDLVVEDAKGVRTAVYRLKKKLMQACYGITVVEV